MREIPYRKSVSNGEASVTYRGSVFTTGSAVLVLLATLAPAMFGASRAPTEWND